MTEIRDPKQQNPLLIPPVDPKLEEYMFSLSGQTDHAVLTQMEAIARENNFPIVGRLVGMFLHSQAKMIGARRVFEFGSGFGYSAYWFAKAVGAHGEVICTDGNPDNKAKAQANLQAAGLSERVEFHSGIAQDTFKQTEGYFDICYNDVDKDGYPEVWNLARERVRPGGLYICDNVLWHGRVAMETFNDIVPGWTEAIREHNELVFHDPNFDTFINPTRDGVLVARRKDE